MATVIDALVVTLGLEAASFDRTSRTTLDGVRKFRQDVSSGATDVERNVRRMQDAFGGVERAIMRLSTVFLGFAGGVGLVTFLAGVQKSIAELYRLGQSLGQSGQELYRWQQVGAQVGATNDEISGSYSRLSRSISDYLLGVGQASPVMRWFAKQGVQFTGPGGGSVGPNQMFTQLNRAIQGESPARQEALLRGLGLSDGTVRMLQQSPEKLAADLGKVKMPTPQEMKDAAVAQAKFNQAWSEMLNISIKLGNIALPVINRELSRFAQDLENLTKEISGYVNAFHRFDKWFSGTWIGRAAARILGEPASKGNTPGNFSERFGSWSEGTTPGGVRGTRPSDVQGSNRGSGAVGNGGAGGGGSDTTNVPMNMQGNDWLKGQREKNIAEINGNPVLKGKLMKLLEAEEGNAPSRTATMEALLNRTAMIQQKNPNHTIAKELDSGFYGPINRAGGLARFGSHMTTASQQTSATAFENAAGGSNLIAGRTDQGTRSGRGDPNAYGPGRVSFLGMNPNSVFNFWKGFRPGAGNFSHSDSGAYADYINKGAANSALWKGAGGADNWGNNARAIPWLQQGGMSIIKGIPSPTTNNSSSSETHIGQFTVNTESRSNPWGMAAQIKDAVQRSNIMDNSNSGPN